VPSAPQRQLGISGVYAAYGRMRRMDITEGSFFSERRLRSHPGGVIGPTRRKKLFSGLNATGQEIRVSGISYHVVGVLKHQVKTGTTTSTSTLCPLLAMSDLANTYYLTAVVMEYEGDHAKVSQGECAIPWPSTIISIPR